MEIKQNAQAGTLESSDVLVMVAKPEKKGIEIELESSVEEIYGDDIKKLLSDTIEKMGVKDILIKVQDKGAFDFIIKARVQTAILKACEVEVPDWSML